MASWQACCPKTGAQASGTPAPHPIWCERLSGNGGALGGTCEQWATQWFDRWTSFASWFNELFITVAMTIWSLARTSANQVFCNACDEALCNVWIKNIRTRGKRIKRSRLQKQQEAEETNVIENWWCIPDEDVVTNSCRSVASCKEEELTHHGDRCLLCCSHWFPIPYSWQASKLTTARGLTWIVWPSIASVYPLVNHNGNHYYHR